MKDDTIEQSTIRNTNNLSSDSSGSISDSHMLDNGTRGGNHLTPAHDNVNNQQKIIDHGGDASIVRTYIGHTHCVRCIETINNNTFISGSYDETIKLWTVHNNNRCIRTFTGHTRCVRALAVVNRYEEHNHNNINDTYFVSGSYDNTIKLWNTNKTECIRTFLGHTSDVNAVSVLTTRKDDIRGNPRNMIQIISGSTDSTIKVWNFDLSTLSSSETQQSVEDTINPVAVIHTYTSYHHPLHNQHFNQQQRLQQQIIERNHVLKQASSTAATTTTTKQTAEKEAAVTDQEDVAIITKCYHTFSSHTSTIFALTKVSQDIFLSGSSDNTIKSWNAKTKMCLHSYEGHTNAVRDICFLNDKQRRFISSSNDHTIKLWSMATPGTCLHTFIGHRNPVWSISTFNYDSKEYYDIHDKNRFDNHNSADTNKRKISSMSNSNANGNDEKKEIRYFVSCCKDNTIKLWDLKSASSSATSTISENEEEAKPVTNTVTADAKNNNSSCIATFHAGSTIRDIVSVPKKYMFITASEDKILQLWKVKSPSKQQQQQQQKQKKIKGGEDQILGQQQENLNREKQQRDGEDRKQSSSTTTTS